MAFAPPVYVHIGLAKTGTTFIQEVLWSNLERVWALDLDLAAAEYVEHVRASRDLVEAGTGRRAARAWDRQAERIRDSESKVVISQEVLSRATTEHAARLVESLAPRPVTVVITARDPARQVASSWQQHVKQRYALPMGDLVDAIRDPADEEAERYWWNQDVPAVLDRWLPHVPADQVVVVTVPPSGSDPAVLWNRFAAACGFDPTGFDLDIRTPNESLGAAQVEVLRRFNAALGDRVVDGYHATVRRFVTNELLAGQPAYERFGVDEHTHAWATEVGMRFVEGVRDRGVRVVGDLNELVPAPYQGLADPSAVDEGRLAASAIELLADLVAHWHEEGRALPKRDRERPRHGGARRRAARDSEAG